MNESQNKITLPKLIAELCPDGVEYKTLGDVCVSLKKETLKQSSLIENGKYPVINSGRKLYGHYSSFNNDCEAITIASRGEYAGFISYMHGKFWAGGLCYPYAVKDKGVCNTRFLYHMLKRKEQEIMDTMVARGGIPALNKIDIDKLAIPLPPIEVQREIVRILDKFTELISLLETERIMRKKQYDYYREKLLTFSDDVPRVPLGEICSKTNRVKWQDNNAQFKYIDLSSVDREDHNIKETIIIDKDNAPSRAQQIVEENDILFGTTRPLLKRTTYISKDYDGQICSTGFCVIRVNEQRAFSRFVFHLINAKNFYDYVKANEQGTSYPCISDSKVKDFEIPLPPLSEQKRIADMLDRFDALCNDTTSGIPAEIAARKKQYEYYRDRLLTFKEKKVD